LMVSAITPDSGELTLLQTMGLRFVGAEIPLETPNNASLDPAPATLSPEIKGTWRQISSNYIVFVPDEPYEPNTTYKLKLDPSFFAEAQIKLRGEREFAFQAAPFGCKSVNLRRERLGGVPSRHRVTGKVLFNYPVDPEKFAAALHLDLDGAPVAFIVETTATSKGMTFRTEEMESGRQDLSLTMTLDGDVSPVGGDVSLGESLVSEEIVPAIERLRIQNVKITSLSELHCRRFDQAIVSRL